jgi:hypothetical protein
LKNRKSTGTLQSEAKKKKPFLQTYQAIKEMLQTLIVNVLNSQKIKKQTEKIVFLLTNQKSAHGKSIK